MAKKEGLKLNEVVLPRYTVLDVQAMQALINGTAEPDQQKRAIKWIIDAASDMHGFHFFPNDRDTNFALGRAFVGQVIVGISKLNAMNLRSKDNAKAG